MGKLRYTIVEGDNEGGVDEFDHVDAISSSAESEISSGSSSESDLFEEVTSSSSSSSSSANDHIGDNSLNDMSSLIQQLPIKRGLSKYYQGKAQSFTSLAKVSSLEDLVKPENPYNKKLKSCRSYGGRMNARHGSQRGSCSSQSVERGSDNFTAKRPPIPPHRSTSATTISNQTALFV